MKKSMTKKEIAEANKEKIAELTDKLEKGVKELFESERYKNYLRSMSKFYQYSFRNSLLIFLQNPASSMVASFTSWKRDFQCNVKKGEQGLKIFCPAPYRVEIEKTDPNTGKPVLDENGKAVKEEKIVQGYKVGYVFDVSQVEGNVPTLVKTLTEDVDNFNLLMSAVKHISPVPIGFEDISGGAKGYFHKTENRIAVQKDMSESQTLKTMVHEVAHSILDNVEAEEKGLYPKDRESKEVRAESVAYVTLQAFRINSEDYSFGYVASWSSGKEVEELQNNMSIIQKTSNQIIRGIENYIKEHTPDKLLAEVVPTVEKAEKKIRKTAHRGR